MIIIPASRPSVFQSIAAIACSWSSVCGDQDDEPAPSSATFVRSIRSVAITPSATTKVATAKATR